MKLKRNDWLIISVLILIVFIPTIIAKFNYGEKWYNIFLFISGFIPIFITHSTSIGLRFRNKYFFLLWIMMIVIHGLLYHKIIPIWVSMATSFIFYNLLRLIFKIINKQDPIPLFIAPFLWPEYNKIEKRKENKKDKFFTMISFIVGLLISTWILIKLK